MYEAPPGLVSSTKNESEDPTEAAGYGQKKEKRASEMTVCEKFPALKNAPTTTASSSFVNPSLSMIVKEIAKKSLLDCRFYETQTLTR